MTKQSEFHGTQNRIIGSGVVEALKKNGFEAEYVETLQDARDLVMDMIEAGASVGFGGSATIAQMELHGELLKKECTLYDHGKAATPEEKMHCRRMQLQSDFFLTGTNALTRDGKLYNMDGTGNRVAAMTFGPKQVIVVAGMNKVVSGIREAEERMQSTAAPLNNIRLNTPNPCVKTGYCMDCKVPTRICNIGVVLHRKPSAVAFKVILVGENLGY